MNMRLKKLGAALVVIAALGAIVASSAFATATTTAAKWQTGSSEGGTSEMTGETSMTASTTGGTFVTHVSGSEIKVTATGVECVGCKITNSPTGASGSGKLKFTGVTVDSPAKCTTTSTIETKALTVNADYMEGTSAMVKFTPTAGEEAGFATFELTGSECALKTSVTPKGYIYGKAANATETYKTTQNVSFSGAINKAANGGNNSFHVGSEEATLETTGTFAAGGLFFGVK